MVAEYTDADTDWVVENRTDGYVYTPGGQVGMALARSVGADLDSGVYSYFTQDHLGSTRGLWDGDKLRLAKLNYAPYGEHDGVLALRPRPAIHGQDLGQRERPILFPVSHV